MTAEPDLLPLPSGNVAHLIAAQAAEVEALRADVAAVKESLTTELRLVRGERDRAMQACETIVGHLAKAETRAERLAEALREIANQGPHYGPDGTYKTWRHWAEIARDALEQEKGRG